MIPGTEDWTAIERFELIISQWYPGFVVPVRKAKTMNEISASQLRQKIIDLLNSLEGLPIPTVIGALSALNESDWYRLEVFCETTQMIDRD